MADEVKKPPLGLTPRLISEMSYLRNRNERITEAVARYMEAELIVPSYWLKEYHDNINRINKLNQEGPDGNT